MLLKSAAKRIFYSFVVLFLLITFIFFLVRLAPGNPTDKYISPKLSTELAAQITKSFGINEPLHIQYYEFAKNIFSGNLGISYTYRTPVEKVILQFLPFTVMFSIISFSLQLLCAFIFSLFSARRLGKPVDKLLTAVSLALYAVPSFFTGVFLIYIFSVQLKILPSSGISSTGSEYFSSFEIFFDYLRHMILPVVTLSLSGAALFYKYLRDEIETVYKKPFVGFLRSHGYDENFILRKHILPNAAGPFISIAGVELGALLGGAIITEVIFGLPGMGRLTLEAVLSRDYPLVIGCTIIAGVMVIISNFLADFLKAILDKRKLQEGVAG
ncbi:MAG: ABC transporter permease [Ignavibacteriaceae bacterium]|nr:ABC transporter permease [Ignavibacteriaceae bacterium]